jgi:hypothetical protein
MGSSSTGGGPTIVSGNIIVRPAKRRGVWGEQMMRCGNVQNVINTAVQAEFYVFIPERKRPLSWSSMLSFNLKQLKTYCA